MQNRNVLLALIIGAIVLLGGGAFLYSKTNKTPTTPTSQSTEQKQPNGMTQGSIQALMGMNKTQECDFESDGQNGGSTSGKIYVAQNQMRGNFTIATTDQKVTHMNVIRNGEDYYVWGDNLQTGLKMKMSVEDFAANAEASQYVNTNQKVNYSCKPWSKNDSQFNPPTDVKFTDMSAMQNMMKENSKSMPTASGSTYSACSVCNGLTGASKTACMSQYNCQ